MYQQKAQRQGNSAKLDFVLLFIFIMVVFFARQISSFAAALPARAQSDEYRDAVAEMMELTGALRNADVVMTQMVGYLKTSAPSVSEAVWEKIISKFNEKMRARMVDIYVPIYSKYLTLADLRELNALYATPVMRKAVGATPAIMQEGMSAGAALGQEIMTELQRELQAGGYE